MAASKFQPLAPYGRNFLLATGTYNFFIAAMLPYRARTAPETLSGGPPFPKSHLMTVDMFSELIAVFGVGYFFASRDLETWWPAVALGSAAKALVWVTSLYYYQQGHIDNRALALGTVDGVWAFLLYRLLKSHAL